MFGGERIFLRTRKRPTTVSGILLAQMCLLNHFPPDLIKHLPRGPVKPLTSASPNELGKAPAQQKLNSGRQNKCVIKFCVLLPVLVFSFFSVCGCLTFCLKLSQDLLLLLNIFCLI